MKTLHILLGCLTLLFSTTSAWACSSHLVSGRYELRGDNIYYQYSYQTEPVLVEEADVATFLNNNLRTNTRNPQPGDFFVTDYAFDANHIYFQGRVLPNIDPSHSVYLAQHFYYTLLTEELENSRLRSLERLTIERQPFIAPQEE